MANKLLSQSNIGSRSSDGPGVKPTRGNPTRVTPGVTLGLPQGYPKTEDKPVSEQKRPPRCCLYSPDCPKGKIFTGADAIAAAEEDGWVDSPTKVKPAGGKAKAKGAS